MCIRDRVGTTITNIESTINNKIEANNTTILNKVDQNIDAKTVSYTHLDVYKRQLPN